MALQSSPSPSLSERSPNTPMWQKLKEQLPAILITIIVIVGVVFWSHQKSVAEAAKNQAALDSLREQHAAELRASAEETRRQIDAVNTLLKDAIQKRSAEAFMSEAEVAKADEEKVNRLAEAIATKIQPFNPLPKTPEEAERIQNEQTDKISSRMAEKIQPILTEMSRDQNLTRDAIAAYSQRISDQVGVVLATEMARNQQLNNNLASTQIVARDSLRLSQEITALYLSSFKDQGFATRLLSLPANLVKDVTSLSLVNSSDRKKMEERLLSQLNSLEQRLNAEQAKMPKK
jgi:CHASE3 domain sensor protein